ncbi:MAG: hypothetical protein GY931_10265, partial [Maribacter sp.]|nr:hypothetical protein [Maribacter sp.]
MLIRNIIDTSTQSGIGSFTTPTPTSIFNSTEQSQGTSRAMTSDDFKSTTEMDTRLADALRLHLVETDRELVIQPFQIRTAEIRFENRSRFVREDVPCTLFPENKEIDTSVRKSEFDIEFLKNEVVKAVREKNAVPGRMMQQVIDYRNGIRRHMENLNRNKKTSPQSGNNFFCFQTKKNVTRSKLEIIAQQVIWNCNKQLVFHKLSETTAEIEREISFSRRKIKSTSGSSDITNKSDSASKIPEGLSSSTSHAKAYQKNSNDKIEQFCCFTEKPGGSDITNKSDSTSKTSEGQSLSIPLETSAPSASRIQKIFFGSDSTRESAKITLKRISEERTFPFTPRFGISDSLPGEYEDTNLFRQPAVICDKEDVPRTHEVGGFGPKITPPQPGNVNEPNPVISVNALYCNVNGWSNKKMELVETILNEKGLDILAITEHKKNRKHDLPNFHTYERWASCREIERGGGTAIWVKKGKFQRVTTLPMASIKKEWEYDQTWIALDTGIRKIAIGVVYYRPVGVNCDREELIEKMQALTVRILELQDKDYEVIVLGDFNAKIETSKDGYYGTDPASKCLIDTTMLTGLEVLNFNPITQGKFTWVPQGKRENQTKSTLDYILHDPRIRFTKCEIDETRQIKLDADHVPILWEWELDTVQVESPSNNNAAWNDFTSVDWPTYNTLVEYNLFTSTTNTVTNSVQENYDLIHRAIQNAGEQIIGRKTDKPRVRKEPRHLTLLRGKLAGVRRQLSKLLTKPDKVRDNRKIDKVRGLIWTYRQTIRDMERDIETTKTYKFMDSLKRERDKNMKNLYSFMNKNKKPVQEKFGLRDDQGNWVSKEVDIKRQLRLQWEKIYNSGCWPNSNLQNIKTELRLDHDTIHKMEEPIQKFEVDKAIDQLHSSTSAGTTDIPPEFLKNLGSRGRQFIFKWSLQIWEEEVFPEQNDVLRTTFLHKKGSTDTLDNYRTLTIGCNICKIYNRILTNRIQGASEESDILGEIQNGFRPGRRATDNLLVLETVIRKSKRNKLNNFIALLDITKAYDRVDREILWHVMKQMGFPTRLINNIQQTYHKPCSVV